ncbi:hypothetical protein A1Q5_18425 [Aliivibrio logei 5S-186]|uniref:Uncharacterized protein n=1 Tax=Aliivibrio logei 5S-186 TaxID=626086 RepID=A0ABX3B0B2_ALILO|nr:hypothetical protein A1Q5_18425 [Aliivibrio logei 5S-186]
MLLNSRATLQNLADHVKQNINKTKKIKNNKFQQLNKNKIELTTPETRKNRKNINNYLIHKKN